MKHKNYTVTAFLVMFVGLVSDIGGAATTLATVAPYLSPYIPLLGLGGVTICVIWLTASLFLYLNRMIRERDAENIRKESKEKEDVVDLLGLVISRLNWGDAFSSNGYFSKEFGEEAQESKLCMKEIRRLGLAPRVRLDLAESLLPEHIDRFGETVWIEHLSKIRPYTQLHGIEAAKAESERLNKEREQN